MSIAPNSLTDSVVAGPAKGPETVAAAVQPIRPGAPRPAIPPEISPRPIRNPVGVAKFRQRHRVLVLSFVLVVLLPVGIWAFYLWGKAADQYASTVGFSVRREEASSAMDLLGGLTGITKSSSSDTDILYQFLQSQKLVADMDGSLGLRKMWAKPQGDPLFAFDPSGSVEDLVDYWKNMVRISYDSSTGLIEVRVLAFTSEDATRIAQALFEESSQMINDLSSIAREDTIRYSRGELQTAEGRLRTAREAITKFRIEHQIVDPSSDIQAQAGLVGSLQNQLAAAQIEQDLLAGTPESDPRIVQITRRIAVINTRITAERSKVGMARDGSQADTFASMAGDYEHLAVEREFAERSYIAALAAYDAAVAEVERKTRYLAAHVLPTTAEVSRFPQRTTLLAVFALFMFLAWAIAALVGYSLKDRR